MKKSLLLVQVIFRTAPFLSLLGMSNNTFSPISNNTSPSLLCPIIPPSLHRAAHTCMFNVVFSAAQAKADKVLSSDMFFFFWFPPGERTFYSSTQTPEIEQDEKNAIQMQKRAKKNKTEEEKRGKVSKS